MNEMITNLYLLWGAVQDIRKRKISNKYLMIGGIGGVGFRIIGLKNNLHIIEDWLFAIVPGILFLFLAKKTREKLGVGDGLVLLVLGSFMTFFEICKLIRNAMILLLLFAVILLCSRKFSKDYQIPFLPFLWLSHLLLWSLKYV